MPFPFPRPSFSPRPSFPSKPPAAPEKKPSWGLAESLGLRGAPPKETGGAQPKPSGIFGPKDYSSFSQQKEWVRSKAPYEPLPGTGQKLTREERIGIVNKLEERSRNAGKPYGLSEQDWRTVVKPQMEKESYQYRIDGEVNKAQALQREIQQIEKWVKGA